MGEEISKNSFSEQDVNKFKQNIRVESALLKDWFKNEQFSRTTNVAGCELEAWLVGPDGKPKPENNTLIKNLKDPNVVHEMSKFNIEFNTEPNPLKGDGLIRMKQSLTKSWLQAEKKAKELNLRLMMIGILPTVESSKLNLQKMTPSNRYFALNKQLMKIRNEDPIELDIEGKDHLHLKHNDVMLEAAATSFQIHLQVDQKKGPLYYNSSKIASAPLVAISANSPFLFGHQLWEESRIPLFEQSVSVSERDYAERVTFGIRFLDDSFVDYFEANRQRYLPILPIVYNDVPEKLRHLCLHNGTIWRWTRVIIGQTSSEEPSLRLEQRVVPAGPTIDDSIANSAFYYGLVTSLSEMKNGPEELMDFSDARNNFYAAAKYGIKAKVTWGKSDKMSLDKLIKNELIPMAKEGLSNIGVDNSISKYYLDIIEDRLETTQTGSEWQKSYKKKHNCSFVDLCNAYYAEQKRDFPVHTWSLDANH